MKSKKDATFIGAEELRATGVTLRTEVHESRRGQDLLERFNTVPNHAFLLYTSEDSALSKYVSDHWAALDGLSGEICDIHVSLLHLQGSEDAYSELSELKTIRGLDSLTLDQLPALHIWSDIAHHTLPLKACTSEAELRDTFRWIFKELHELAGPITSKWSTEVADRRPTHSSPKSLNNAQAIVGSTAGRDMVQIINNFVAQGERKENTMPSNESKDSGAKPPPAQKLQGSQSIEDVQAGGKISQHTNAETDAQSIRRARNSGDVSQTKQATSEMSFLGGKARGYGVVALLLAILGWLAYKYFAKV